MAKKTLDDVIKARKALVKELDDYDKDKSKLDTRINKVMMEYGTIKKGLEEGSKEITDLKTQLKSAFDTWTKMSGKLDGIKTNLGTVAKEVKATIPGLDKFDDEADGLSKELANCGGDVADIKDEAEELKKVKKMAGRLVSDYNNLYNSSSSPPADPPKPTLAVS